MSFPRYDSYKESGVEWLGNIPAHWAVERLKRVSSVSPSNIDKKHIEGEQPVRLCNYTDVYYNDRITSDLELMSATATAEQIEKFTLKSGQTIITKDSETADDIAIAAFVPDDLPGIVCGYHLSVVTPAPRTCGPFIKRFFDSSFAKACVQVRANGLTRVGLNQYAIDNLELPFPPKAEQTAICRFLDRETAKIDALIAEQQRLIELLTEKRQAVISHFVTKGLDPNAPMKDSGIDWLGLVPRHWTMSKARRLFRWVKRQDQAQLPALSVYRDFGVIEKSSRDDNINKTPDDLSLYQTVNHGDLVINKMKAWQGSLGIAAIQGITSPDYAVFMPLHSELPAFLNYLFRCKLLPPIYMSISNGIRPDQWRVEPDKFLQLNFALPPADEQGEIVAFLDCELEKFDQLGNEAETAISLLQERRGALISAAVTGTIDVRGLVSVESEAA